MNYQIKVVPEPSLMDENAVILIKGEASEKLKLHLSTEDYYNVNGDIRLMDVGTKWECDIPIELDQDGCAQLDACIFTKLTIVNGKKSTLEQELSRLAENRDCHITMELRDSNQVLTSLIHTRCFCDESVISQDVIGDDLLARYFVRQNHNGKTKNAKTKNTKTKNTKTKNTKRPAMIVVSGSDGRIEKAQAIAQCLAMKGYATLAVCYYGMAHVSADLSQVPMEYIEHAIGWLKNREEVDPDRIGIYGRSKGGEMALLAATLFPELKCVIANTPSNYVQEGLIGGNRTSGHSSWCYRGIELSYVKDTFIKVTGLVIGLLMKDPFTFRKFYEK